MRDPNFMSPTRCPRASTSPSLYPADDPPGQDAHHLPEHDGASRVIDPDFVQLVVVRAGVVRRQEPPRPVLDSGHAAGDGRAVDVHVHGGQEDGDLRPLAGRRPAAVARPRDHYPAVGRRHHEVGLRGDDAVRIAEEVGEEPAGGGTRPGQHRAARQRGRQGRQRSRRDERVSGAIDFHVKGCLVTGTSHGPASEPPGRRGGGPASRYIGTGLSPGRALACWCCAGAGSVPSDPSTAACVS